MFGLLERDRVHKAKQEVEAILSEGGGHGKIMGTEGMENT